MKWILALFCSTAIAAQNYSFIRGPSIVESTSTTATAASTTTLTATSNDRQQFTGSTTQTVVLPDATTLDVGRHFYITNRSSGTVTVEYNGGSTAQAMAGATGLTPSGTILIAVLEANGAAAGTWDISYATTPYVTGNLTDSTSGSDGISVTGGTNAVFGSGTSIAQLQSSGSQNGYLSSTDWTTFNNKQAAFSGLNTDGVIYATSGTAVSSTSAGTTGEVLISTTSSAPSFSANPTVTSLGVNGGSSGGIVSNASSSTMEIGYDSNTTEMILGSGATTKIGIGMNAPQAQIHFGLTTGNSNTTSGTVGSNAMVLGRMNSSNNLGADAVILGCGGSGCTASGQACLAAIDGSRCMGSYSVAIGDGAIANGLGHVAIGDNAETSGSNTGANSIGYNTTASGQGSIALGYGTTAQGYGQTVVGAYNTAQGTGSSRVSTDEAFIVGNGVSGTTSNAFSVNNNGTTKLWGTTSGYVGLLPAASTTSYTLNLPSSGSPGAGSIWTLDGSNNVGFSQTPTLGVNGTTGGTLALANGTSGGGAVTLSNPSTTSANAYTFAFPSSGGTNGYALTTNGSGTTSWTSVLTNPMTTGGDMIYGGSSGAPTRLAAGSSGQVPISAGTSVAFGTLPGNSTALKAPTYQVFTVAGNTTTGTISTSSVCVTSVGSTAYIHVGDGITDSTHSTAITKGTYVVGIPGTCSSGQIQMSADAATSETGDTLVFGATMTTTATISTSSVCLTSVGNTAGIAPGAYITDTTHPTAITTGTTVVAVPGTCSSGQIQMSADGATAETGDTVVISGGQYTLPSDPAPLYIRIKMVGGGGGGGGAGSSDTSGSAGTSSVFGASSAGGGSGGGGSQSAGGVGGTATLASTAVGVAITGQAGGGGGGGSGGTAGIPGGYGGNSPYFAGGGSGEGATPGQPGVANTGGGGAGGGSANTTTVDSAAGGGSGGFIDAQISSPSSTYAWFVGAGGANGTGGTENGGSGAAGQIIIEEHYQ